MAHRQQTTPEGEPLIDDTRKLSIAGSENPCVMVNISKQACDIVGFPRGRDATGTEVKIEVYPDKYVIRPLPPEEQD